MLKLIMGLKGMGKTKQLIDMVNEAVAKEPGNVICIEKGTKLRYDISREARLISTESYGITDFDMFYGFICGILAGNHDITAIYIDSLFKICEGSMEDLEKFAKKLDKLCQDGSLSITATVSWDENEATDIIKSYF